MDEPHAVWFNLKLCTISPVVHRFWATPRRSQGLLLTLSSGITPGRPQGTIWSAEK